MHYSTAEISRWFQKDIISSLASLFPIHTVVSSCGGTLLTSLCCAQSGTRCKISNHKWIIWLVPSSLNVIWVFILMCSGMRITSRGMILSQTMQQKSLGEDQGMWMSWMECEWYNLKGCFLAQRLCGKNQKCIHSHALNCSGSQLPKFEFEFECRAVLPALPAPSCLLPLLNARPFSSATSTFH